MEAGMKPGDRIGDYEVLSELGRGGMGRVYKVRNVISDRVEAMKILLPELAGRQELAARFLREIKLVASLEHPNIAALRTAMTLDDQLVMIMEFVEGASIDERLEGGALPIGEALDCTGQALQGLGYAHQRGVVHRDIKPANLMVTREGVVKVMDFGIAFSGSEHKLTSTGTTLGSLAYMSPEQVRGEAADPRSDLYSLGIALYEMVTGTRPFKADSDYAIMAAHVKEAPRPPVELQPGLPEGLNDVILTAIAKEKEQRFQSAEEFRQALARVAAPAQESTRVYSAPAGERGASASTRLMTPPPGGVAPATRVETPRQPTPAAPKPATVPATPPAMPQAMPPPVAQGSGHRGIYLGLGAVLALLLLIAVGTFLRPKAAEAPGRPAPAPAAQAPAPSAEPAGTRAAAGPTATRPTEQSKPAAPAPAAEDPAAAAAAAAARKAAAEKAAREAALEELEKQIDGLNARFAAVDTSLETLRQRQRAAGYDLRGDITAKQESLRQNMAKAREAFDRGDPERGKKFADQAELLVGQLEKFLGR
jgi:serine/threonine-protein kinase